MSITQEEAPTVFTRYIETRLGRQANAQELQEILDIFSWKALPKGHTLKAPDTVCKYVGFLLQGCVRHYAFLPDGKDVTVRVVEGQALITDGQGLADQTASALGIETTEDSLFLMARLPAYIHLLDSNLTLNIVSRKAILEQSLVLGKRITNFSSGALTHRVHG